MVPLFDGVVGVGALVALGAPLSRCHGGTEFRTEEAAVAPSIASVVEIGADDRNVLLL